jgi:hypothetical protein
MPSTTNHRLRWPWALTGALLALATAAPIAAQTDVTSAATAAAPVAAAPPQEAKPPAQPTALSVGFELFNVAAGSRFAIRFDHGLFVGDVAFVDGVPEAVRQALKLDGNSLAFALPPGIGTQPRLAFSARVAFDGDGAGSFDGQPPTLAAINSGWGAVIVPGGKFVVPVESLPPSCTLGCLPGKGCRGPGETCYLYDSQFLCCTVCPTGC